MAYPQEPPQPPYQTTDLRPTQGHHIEGVGYFPVPATTTTAPTTTQSATIPTQTDPYAVGAWGGGLKDLTCPSGQRCAIRKPQIEDLIAVGLLDKINVLAGITDAQVWQNQGMPPIDTAKIMQDPAKMGQMVDLLNTVVVMAVARPTILSAVGPDGQPLPLEGRKPDAGYTDFISLSDKVAIFEAYVEDLGAMAPFRAGAQQPGERMAHEPGAALPTEHAVRGQ